MGTGPRGGAGMEHPLGKPKVGASGLYTVSTSENRKYLLCDDSGHLRGSCPRTARLHPAVRRDPET